MINNVHWNSDFGYAGPYTTFHHKCFQIIDLMTLHWKRAMNGLNPHTLLHEPTEHNTKHMEENNASSKGEQVEQQQSRINELMTGYNFGWRVPSTFVTRKK